MGAGDRIAQLVLEQVSTPPVLEVWDLDDRPQTPSAVIANSGYLRESLTYEIEDTIPLRVSPSRPIPQVRLPVNQTLGDRDCQGHSHPKLSAPLRGSNRPLLASTELVW